MLIGTILNQSTGNISRKNEKLVHKSYRRQPIGIQPETSNNSFAIRRNIRMMPNTFPGRSIAYVYLDNRCFYRPNGISNRNGSVRICTSIQYDSVIFKPCLMQMIDDFPFYIRLKIREFYSWKLILQINQIIFKTLFPINY